MVRPLDDADGIHLYVAQVLDRLQDGSFTKSKGRLLICQAL
jgi:hypothetical protein